MFVFNILKSLYDVQQDQPNISIHHFAVFNQSSCAPRAAVCRHAFGREEERPAILLGPMFTISAAEPPRLKYQAALVLEDIPASRAEDDAFWAMLVVTASVKPSPMMSKDRGRKTEPFVFSSLFLSFFFLNFFLKKLLILHF